MASGAVHRMGIFPPCQEDKKIQEGGDLEKKMQERPHPELNVSLPLCPQSLCPVPTLTHPAIAKLFKYSQFNR